MNRYLIFFKFVYVNLIEMGKIEFIYINKRKPFNALNKRRINPLHWTNKNSQLEDKGYIFLNLSAKLYDLEKIFLISPF